MAKQKDKTKYLTLYSPVGMCSYPYLVKPDTGRKESSNKFSIEIFVPKARFAEEGKEFAAQILNFAREYYKKPKLKMSDFKGPITDMDNDKDCPDYAKGCLRIRAKAGNAKDLEKTLAAKPKVIGPRKDPETKKYKEWTDEQIAAIKGGDDVRLVCGIYGYDQDPSYDPETSKRERGGIALGLNFVQFIKEGKALGQGRMKAVENLDEVEVTPDNPDEIVDQAEPEDVDPAMDFG